MITPYFQDSHITIYNKSCFDMSELPDNSIQCIVTSPPYWGLRKYKAPDLIFGGNNHHEHEWMGSLKKHLGKTISSKSTLAGYTSENIKMREDYGEATTNTCSICGAWKGQYGLEPNCDCGRPFMELREDLTEKELEYVMAELKKCGLL